MHSPPPLLDMKNKGNLNTEHLVFIHKLKLPIFAGRQTNTKQ